MDGHLPSVRSLSVLMFPLLLRCSKTYTIIIAFVSI